MSPVLTENKLLSHVCKCWIHFLLTLTTDDVAVGKGLLWYKTLTYMYMCMYVLIICAVRKKPMNSPVKVPLRKLFPS